MKWDEQRRARAGLCALGLLADPDVASLVAAEGAAPVWAAMQASSDPSPRFTRARAIDIDALIEATVVSRSRFVIPGDDEWPSALADLDACGPVGGMGGAPFGLWVAGPGSLSEARVGALALVGSRACTSYGSMVAHDFGFELAEGGRTVISGGAYGIDAAAHAGALAAEGFTVAVLANGVDVAYPRGNAALLEKVATRGLVVSELPPGVTPSRPGFLARNRVIAALAQGVVIIEAALRSGARNTASWALALGRPLMAVPGPVHSVASASPHRMIRDGEATLVASVADTLAVVAPFGDAPMLPFLGEERVLDDLDQTELAVREALPGRGARSAGEVSLITGFDVPTCLATLGRLEVSGLVAVDDVGRWRLARPGADRGS